MNTSRVINFAWNIATALSRPCLSGFLVVALSAATAATADAAERGRVRVQNGTVVSDRNTILRGATMVILHGPGNSNNSAYWRHLSNLGINAVRLGVKTGQIGRSVQQQLPALDRAVESAAKNNIYVMIQNSEKPGGYNLNQLKQFWSVVADRYKNRTHVFYEMTNEPVNGGPHWGNVVQYTDKVRDDLKSVYDIMRRDAPNTHIVLLSTPNLYPDCQSYAAMIAKIKGVDWSKTSVGFHHYNGTVKFGERGLNCLRQKYPLIMTETSFWTEPERWVLKNDLAMYEKLRISWFSLDGKGSTRYLQNDILPSLRRAGYSWRSEN